MMAALRRPDVLASATARCMMPGAAAWDLPLVVTPPAIMPAPAPPARPAAQEVSARDASGEVLHTGLTVDEYVGLVVAQRDLLRMRDHLALPDWHFMWSIRDMTVLRMPLTCRARLAELAARYLHPNPIHRGE